MDKTLNRYFPKIGVYMASKHIKRCPALLVTEEMQIKSKVLYRHKPSRMTKITNVKC